LLWAIRWTMGIIILFAPAFAFIDVALSECAEGLTAEDLQRIRWIVDDVDKMREHGLLEKMLALRGRLYPVTAVAALLIGLLMIGAPCPLETRRETLSGVLWFSIILSPCPYGATVWTPIITSALRSLFLHEGAGRALMDVIEISADYAIGCYNTIMEESFLKFLGLLMAPSLLILAGALPQILIGFKRGMYLKDKHPLRKVLYELTWRSVEEEKRRILQQTNSRGNWSTQAKRHSAPDISVFTDHIRRSIEKAKKGRDGGERRSAPVYEHQKRREEVEETQVFKRRVKEKDRVSYIA